MKNIIGLLALIFLVNLTMTGCYTIIWDPTEEASYSNNYGSTDEFYGEVYYGNYGEFYESPPWWFTNPVFISSGSGSGTTTKDRTNGRKDETTIIRNDRDRGINERDPGFPNGDPGPIINTPPPTRNVGSGNTSETQTPSSTGSRGSSSDNGSRNSSSGNSNDNSSVRNSGNGRR